MKKPIIMMLVLGTLVLTMVLSVIMASQSAFKTQREKFSYCIGVDFGKSLKRQEADSIDLKIFMRGLEDYLNNKKLLLTDAEMKEVFDTFTKERKAKQEERDAKEKERLNKLSAKNKKEGTEFLAKNKQKEGVITLPSGLQYRELTPGSGAVPNLGSIVVVNYRGTFIDGTEFDSSVKNGGPLTIPVASMIPGWKEAIQKMKVGAKWQLFIPQDLAYGEYGAGDLIGPYATLIFEVELLGIK